MKLSASDLHKAVDNDIITEKQAQNLYTFLSQQPHSPEFNFTNVLYYFGGLIAIGAMTLFMNVSWEVYGGFGIVGVGSLYALLGLGLTEIFRKKDMHIPAGICATFVVALIPLIIYGFQKGMGWWPDNNFLYYGYSSYADWKWLYMEFGTLIFGIILIWIYRYPFMLMPIAVTLWYMSQDIAIMLTAQAPDYIFRSKVSMFFGLIILLIAFWVDMRSRKGPDYAFWLYLFGVIAFWGGLSLQSSDSELSKFFYFCINLILILLGTLLSRKVFVVFGALGIAFYLGHLAFTVFEDSLFFPFSLTIIGGLFIGLGVLWQRHQERLMQHFRQFLPKAVRELLEDRL